jgi:hypothetical protein
MKCCIFILKPFQLCGYSKTPLSKERVTQDHRALIFRAGFFGNAIPGSEIQDQPYSLPLSPRIRFPQSVPLGD